ncbi:HAD family hydrolase [Clostridium folliculivorans]|uniref:Noncanonical pyrimidine nucleotidase, YjjG family protein n=1 Tax=Clostridium folliculivorans TaxID=2886038 RepID=A0A9W5Y6E8_9CLOT|nr:HAD family hydrolase [Clostridium folliculivorans]GKU27506.1 noncanonical pyrimidine nucleotidase, YjjG family protein [Clostridium folliculivorans]GKU32356.1 noncanonical pyrimidine nucleotidase, YjjG family protein [Clostridium folliculivorans]
MKFDLISIDMFQTLVNIQARKFFIWRRILKEQFNEELALECAKSVSKNVITGFHKSASINGEFVNLKNMFKPFFRSVFEEMNICFDEEEAVKIFMDEHTNSEPYDDVERFFSLIADSIPICLVTDADYEMVMPILEKYKFDEVFISEKVMSYKNEPNSKIFKEVLKHYSVDPSRVLHIGDSSSDIIGANRVGIKSCWINRDDLKWDYSIQPDYIIKSLNEVIDIL